MLSVRHRFPKLQYVRQELRSKWNGAADKRVSSGELTETLAFEELVREMQANNNGTPRSAASINFEEVHAGSGAQLARQSFYWRLVVAAV